MKARNLIAVVGTGLCVGLSACAGHDGSGMYQPNQPSQPAPPTTMMLSVNDVLAKAKVQPEMDDPFDVNGGVVTLSPSDDEESDPASID